MGNRRTFFALTPSPSPTAWERGVGAHGGAPCSVFPLSRRAGEGGEGKKARLPVHARAGKIAPAATILCRTDVPLPDLKEGGCDRQAVYEVQRFASSSTLGSTGVFRARARLLRLRAV